jgi:hypothetical protein
MSSTTKQSPFYLWYGQHPQFHAESAREEKVPQAEELANNIKIAMEEAKAMILLAQERQKRQADTFRKESPNLEIGDKVWLKRENIKTTRPTDKLNYRYLGPYPILKKIGKMAYKLKLPEKWRIHNVFHINRLEKLSKDNWDRTPVPVPPIEVDGEFQHEVDQIKNARVYQNRLEYFVSWVGYGIDEEMWIPATDVFAEDKIRQFYLKNPNAVTVPQAKRKPPRERTSNPSVSKRHKSHR